MQPLVSPNHEGSKRRNQNNTKTRQPGSTVPKQSKQTGGITQNATRRKLNSKSKSPDRKPLDPRSQGRRSQPQPAARKSPSIPQPRHTLGELGFAAPSRFPLAQNQQASNEYQAKLGVEGLTFTTSNLHHLPIGEKGHGIPSTLFERSPRNQTTSKTSSEKILGFAARVETKQCAPLVDRTTPHRS